MLTTKREVTEWLVDMDIEDFVVHDDLTVDVTRGVDISSMGLTEIPVQFGMVTGYFDCSWNVLTSLKGAPSKVMNQFNCSENNLKSLEFAPEQVGRYIDCSHNQLESLKGAPKVIYLQSTDEVLRFECHNNLLVNLEGIDDEVDYIDCSNNKITDYSAIQNAELKVFESDHGNSVEQAINATLHDELGNLKALLPKKEKVSL